MFCTSCGNPIVAGQAVCAKCGTPTSAGLMQGGGPRVAQHHRTLAILTIIYSGLHALGGLGALFAARFVLGPIFSQAREGSMPPTWIIPLVTFMGWLILAKGIVGLAAGVGLLARETWARTLTLIVGFLSLIDIPLGTALGIYTIWVLLSGGSEEEYRKLSLAAGH